MLGKTKDVSGHLGEVDDARRLGFVVLQPWAELVEVPKVLGKVKAWRRAAAREGRGKRQGYQGEI